MNDSSVRLAELMAALSVATDYAMGQPIEFALRSCILSLRLARELELSEVEEREVYYLALLRYIGCNAETHTLSSIVGDEIVMRGRFASVDNGRQTEVLGVLLRSIRETHAGASALHVARGVARGLLSLPKLLDGFNAHCEVAQRLASRLGFEPGLVAALGQLYERWDGKGLPRGLRGEKIARSVRIVSFAQDLVTFHRLDGEEAATKVARERKGKAYEPLLVERFFRIPAATWFEGLEAGTWKQVLELEPGPRGRLSGPALDEACRALADYVDIKSPFTVGHSAGVAALAERAAGIMGLPQDECDTLRRAALLHDLGRVGVSSLIWEKPGAFSDSERERVRLHAYYTERILAQGDELKRIGALASHAHERADKSGYFRSNGGAAIPPAARLLAAADAFHAMTEPRPHRAALSPEAAATELGREVRAGRIDSEAAAAVLHAAGQRSRSAVAQDRIAGLTARELEVLRLIARGKTNREIARMLFISDKTAGHHVEHIFEKAGVRTRAGAAMFAMERGLIS